MLKHFGWLILAAGSLLGTSGCACWNHMWGSWAYYGDCNSCGYCDNCPSGPCSGGCGGGCDECRGLGVYPPPGGYCGMYDNCGSQCCETGCCPSHCGPQHCCWLLKIFHWRPCCDPCGYPHGGCGELYMCDWINHPPTCDPCDCCGNYIGDRDPRPCYQASPRYGSVWPSSYNRANEGYNDADMVEGEVIPEEVAPRGIEPRRAAPRNNGRAVPPSQPIPGPAVQPNNPTFQPQNLPSVRRNTLPSVQRRPANSYPVR